MVLSAHLPPLPSVVVPILSRRFFMHAAHHPVSCGSAGPFLASFSFRGACALFPSGCTCAWRATSCCRVWRALHYGCRGLGGGGSRVAERRRRPPHGQPPPTAYPTASATGSEAPFLLMHPCAKPWVSRVSSGHTAKQWHYQAQEVSISGVSQYPAGHWKNGGKWGK